MASAITVGVEHQGILPQLVCQTSVEENTQVRQEKDANKYTPDQGNSEQDRPEQVHAPRIALAGKEQHINLHHHEAAWESEKARIECLGRDRPAKFKSFGAELAFCYSIIASQFMAVSSTPHVLFIPRLTASRNFSCPGSTSSCQL